MYSRFCLKTRNFKSKCALESVKTNSKCVLLVINSSFNVNDDKRISFNEQVVVVY